MATDFPAFSTDGIAARLAELVPRSRIVPHRLAGGATLFRQGDPATSVFLVETGRIRLVRFLADGAAVVLQVARDGESFAEASLSALYYHCDAVAETDTAVWALPKSDLLSALARDPSQSLAIALALAGQVRDLRARLELRDVRSATERVLGWLRLHASGVPPTVPVRSSWTRVAEEIGLSREAVYRALADLERRKRISRRLGVVVLAAPD